MNKSENKSGILALPSPSPAQVEQALEITEKIVGRRGKASCGISVVMGIAFGLYEVALAKTPKEELAGKTLKQYYHQMAELATGYRPPTIYKFVKIAEKAPSYGEELAKQVADVQSKLRLQVCDKTNPINSEVIEGFAKQIEGADGIDGLSRAFRYLPSPEEKVKASTNDPVKKILREDIEGRIKKYAKMDTLSATQKDVIKDGLSEALDNIFTDLDVTDEVEQEFRKRKLTKRETKLQRDARDVRTLQTLNDAGKEIADLDTESGTTRQVTETKNPELQKA